MKSSRKSLFFVLVFVSIFSVYSSIGQAAPLCVDDAADDGNANIGDCDASCDSGGNCSLRDAVFAANGNSTDEDVITFSPSLPGTITLFMGNSLQLLGPVQINGPGPIINANGNNFVFDFQAPGQSCSISGLTLTGAVSQQVNINNGNLTISDCKIIDGPGRGIGSVGAGVTLTIRNSTVSGNTSPDDEFAGGGLTFDGGTLIIENSTFSNNTAPNDTAFDIGGGAISIYDDSPTEVTLTNVTISENQTEESGGGILIDGTFFANTNALNVHLTNVTIAKNMAESDGSGSSSGGGIFVFLAAEDSVELQNVLIADNSVGTGGVSPDCLIQGTGSVVSNGFNLVEDDTNCTGLETTDITGQDPLLAALNDNSPGTTATQALDSGSRAINAAEGAPVCPPTDQRGVSRPQGSACDIGAYEAVVCGDGTEGPGEECEVGEECCASNCLFEPAGTVCADGTCDGSGNCVSDSGGGCALGSMSHLFSILDLSPMLLALGGLALFRRKVR
jgi:hypothetical protein